MPAFPSLTKKDSRYVRHRRAQHHMAFRALGCIALLLLCAAASVALFWNVAGASAAQGAASRATDNTGPLTPPPAQAAATPVLATPTPAATTQPTATAQPTVTPRPTVTPQPTATPQATATPQPTATTAPAPTQQNSSPPIIIPVQQTSGPNPAAIVLAIVLVLLLAALAALITWLIMRRRAAAPITPQAPVSGEWERIEHVRVDPAGQGQTPTQSGNWARIEHGEVEAAQPPYLQPGYGQSGQPGEVYEGGVYSAPAPPYHEQPTVPGSATPPPIVPLSEQESSALPPSEDSRAQHDGRPISPDPNNG